MGRKVTDPALLDQLNQSAPSRKVADPALLEQLNAAPVDIPGVRTLRTKPAKNQTEFSLPVREGAKMGTLIPGRLMPGEDPMPGGVLPPDLTVPSGTSTAPNLTPLQQRLGEFARINNAAPGVDRLKAQEAPPIGTPPASPYEDEKLGGEVLWQMQNKGGTYDPNYRMTMGERAKDLHDSAMSGLSQTVAFAGGAPGELQHIMPAVGAWSNKMLGYEPKQVAEWRKMAEGEVAKYPLPRIADVQRGMERMQPGSVNYKSPTGAGRLGQTVASFAGPGMLAKSGGGFLRSTILPGAAFHGGMEASDGNPLVGMGAMLASPLAAKATLAGVGRMLPGGVDDASRRSAADVLRREGIRTTAGDVLGNKTLRTAESELGGGAYTRFREGQLEDLTEAALRRVGHQGRRADVATLNQIDRNIGRQFEQLGARNIVTPDSRFGYQLGDAFRRYTSNTSAINRINRPQEMILELAQGGATPRSAARWQALRSEAHALARKTQDPHLKDVYRGIGNAIDDAMERSIARTNPADLGKYRTARRQWRNFLPIQEAMSGASEATNLGLITPAMLAQGVRLKHGRSSIARGRGDLSELARASNAMLRDLPNSMTAGRSAVRFGPAAVGAATGAAGAGLLTGEGWDDPVKYLKGGLTAAAAGSLGLAAPALLGRALLSAPVRKLLAKDLGAPLRTAAKKQGWKWPLAGGVAAGGLLGASPYTQER